MAEHAGGPRTAGDLPAPLAELLGLLACPRCTGRLASSAGGVVCATCGAVYPVSNGILELALPDASDPSPEGSGAVSRPSASRGWPVGWATRCELRVLRRLLVGQGRLQTLLDLPSAGGRLAPVLGPQTRLLIEADANRDDLARARRDCRLESEPAFLTASVLNIPLRDGAVDAVVCCRPYDALPSPDGWQRMIGELLRVARRFVAVSFADGGSLSSRLVRALGGREGAAESAIRPAELAEIAHSLGAHLLATPRLCPVLSSRRIALLAKAAPITHERSRRPVWRLSWRATG